MSGSDDSVLVSAWDVVPERPVGRVVVLPGGSGYTVDHPILWWVSQALAEGGWHVVTVRWQVDGPAREDPTAFVSRAAERALDLAGPAERTLVVGKSFGTWAAPWAAERGWPGVWLTPVLTAPEVARAVTDSRAPGLLVGGTADDLWDHSVAAGSGLDVLEIEGADHVLCTPGDWRTSHENLRRTVEAVERFAATLLEPGAPDGPPR